jgi:hypothetical protein
MFWMEREREGSKQGAEKQRRAIFGFLIFSLVFLNFILAGKSNLVQFRLFFVRCRLVLKFCPIFNDSYNLIWDIFYDFSGAYRSLDHLKI